jgi:uncharacterized membrane protein YqjE
MKLEHKAMLKVALIPIKIILAIVVLGYISVFIHWAANEHEQLFSISVVTVIVALILFGLGKLFYMFYQDELARLTRDAMYNDEGYDKSGYDRYGYDRSGMDERGNDRL